MEKEIEVLYDEWFSRQRAKDKQEEEEYKKRIEND
jgi:hypothetical protein